MDIETGFEKKPAKAAMSSKSSFESLPDEIIQQILFLADPNTFASLILVNTTWRRVSQQADLYAHHLMRCPSFSASHKSFHKTKITDKILPRLRRLFALEVKRNLFEAYLRPKVTKVKLVSNSISSSSVPGGDGMLYNPSPLGHKLLAYNSSRIYVVDLKAPELSVTRELKILRRPVSTCITDDGGLLAVLSSDMEVDLYDLKQSPPRRKQSLILDHTPRTIAMSPCGTVLAAAYEGGIEVTSVNPGALATERRAVKCDAVDALAFSFDGTQLLGTTTTSQSPNTVILTAPYYDPGAQMGEENISALWTTSILFPNTSRDCSHAVLIQESRSIEAAWTFTYDRSFETFRAVRIDDLRNGTTYFTGPIPTSPSQTTLIPCTLPAANYQGELVAAGFEGQDVWLYGVPEDLDAVPDMSSNAASIEASHAQGLNRRNSAQSVRSPGRTQEANGARVPQWQILCDKFRNTFVAGRKITQLSGVSSVKWVHGYGGSSTAERLIVAARGIMPPKLVTEEDGIDFIDGGRIAIVDFDYRVDNGHDDEIIIEVGNKEPEVLEEEQRDLAADVAIVRRRTVAQRKGNVGGASRSAAAIPPPPPVPQDILPRRPEPSEEEMEDPLVPRPMPAARVAPDVAATEEVEEASLEEAMEALDAPYAHANPRSQTTLRRAATAAAANRNRQPTRAVAGPVEYRRADGRREHPHESDADNWVPPPPPYSKEDTVDLPSFLRQPSVAPVAQDQSEDEGDVRPSRTAGGSAAPRSSTARPARNRPDLPRLHTSPTHERRQSLSTIASPPSTVLTRQVSVSASAASPPMRFETASQRPTSSPVRAENPQTEDGEDLYDVSPIEDARRQSVNRQAATTETAEQPRRQPQQSQLSQSLPTQQYSQPQRQPQLQQPVPRQASYNAPLPTQPAVSQQQVPRQVSYDSPLPQPPQGFQQMPPQQLSYNSSTPVPSQFSHPRVPSQPLYNSPMPQHSQLPPFAPQPVHNSPMLQNGQIPQQTYGHLQQQQQQQQANSNQPRNHYPPQVQNNPRRSFQSRPGSSSSSVRNAPMNPRHVATPSNGSVDMTYPSVQIPAANSAWNNATPVVGRLPTAQTWPRAPSQSEPAVVTALNGYPQSAPANGYNGQMVNQVLQPARPDQLSNYYGRQDQQPPARAPGNFQVPRVPVGSRDGMTSARRASRDQQREQLSQRAPMPQPQPVFTGYHTSQQSTPVFSTPAYATPTVSTPQFATPTFGTPTFTTPTFATPTFATPTFSSPTFSSPTFHPMSPEPDQPLIISTPTGVSGAFDPPDRTVSERRATEPMIHAPVPRHPRATPGAGPIRPHAERLEGIYSRTANSNGNNVGFVEPPPSQLTATSLRHHTSQTRRQSRAQRSAAKNLKDAEGRGWNGRKKRRRKQRDADAASSAAWTDVTWASTAPTESLKRIAKCVVM